MTLQSQPKACSNTPFLQTRQTDDRMTESSNTGSGYSAEAEYSVGVKATRRQGFGVRVGGGTYSGPNTPKN